MSVWYVNLFSSGLMQLSFLHADVMFSWTNTEEETLHNSLFSWGNESNQFILTLPPPIGILQGFNLVSCQEQNFVCRGILFPHPQMTAEFGDDGQFGDIELLSQWQTPVGDRDGTPPSTLLSDHSSRFTPACHPTLVMTFSTSLTQMVRPMVDLLWSCSRSLWASFH